MATGKICEAGTSCGRTCEPVSEGHVAFWVFYWSSFVSDGGEYLVDASLGFWHSIPIDRYRPSFVFETSEGYSMGGFDRSGGRWLVRWFRLLVISFARDGFRYFVDMDIPSNFPYPSFLRVRGLQVCRRRVKVDRKDISFQACGNRYWVNMYHSRDPYASEQKLVHNYFPLINKKREVEKV